MVISRPRDRRDWAAIFACLVGVAAVAVLAYAWAGAAAEAEHWRQLYVQLMEDTAPLAEHATTTVTALPTQAPEDLGRVTS